MRSRRRSNHARSAVAAGGESAPSSSKPRRRWRSRSLRISSRTYSLDVPYPRVATCRSTKAFSDSGSDMFIVLMKGTIGTLAIFGKNRRIVGSIRHVGSTSSPRTVAYPGKSRAHEPIQAHPLLGGFDRERPMCFGRHSHHEAAKRIEDRCRVLPGRQGDILDTTRGGGRHDAASPSRIISRRTRRNRTVHRVLLWSDDSDFDRFVQRIHDRRPDSGSSEKTVPSIHDAVEARSRCDGR